MPAQQAPGPTPTAAAAARLHEIAQLLRAAHELGPEEQCALAELADELGSLWDQPTDSAAPTPALAERIAHLADSLHHGRNRGLLQGFRQKLEEVAAKMEGRAPHGAAFARQLADVFAGLGI
jgi:hypothetical protein